MRRLMIVFVLLAIVTSFIVPAALAAGIPDPAKNACGGLLTASSTSWRTFPGTAQGAHGYVNPAFQGSLSCPGPIE